MAVKTHYTRLARYYFNDNEPVNSLIEFCEGLRLPMTPGYVSERYPINQKILNAMFRVGLESLGWNIDSTNNRIVPKETNKKLNQEGDFNRVLSNGIRVFGEIEFGNIASAWRDLFKFNLVISFDTFDTGIFILPTEKISSEIEGCYSYEKVLNIIKSASSSINCPLLIIGLDPDRHLDVDTRELEPNYGNDHAGWKSQSNTFWDEFVERHSEVLLPSIS